MSSKPCVEKLVADSAAFLRNIPLHQMACEVLTVPEVVAEIKDKPTRERLQVLPYDLKLKDPSDDCIRQISDFAKATGDFRFLSATDVRVLALTLQVTRETMGTAHVRFKPPAPRPEVSFYHPKQGGVAQLPVGFVSQVSSLSVSEPSVEVDDAQKSGGQSAESGGQSAEAGGQSAESGGQSAEAGGQSAEAGGESSEAGGQSPEAGGQPEESGGQPEESGDQPVGTENEDSLHSAADSVGGGGGPDATNETDEPSGEMFDAREVPADDDTDEADEIEEDEGDDDDDDDDDDDGWITPSNLQTAKLEMNLRSGEVEESVKVACMTTDFTMQNVLKQMNLEMVSVEGRRIREARRFIQRCFGCTRTTPHMDKTFCPWCGNKTLKRVAVTLRPDGTQQIHISTRKPISKRGTKFSLPLPRGGKYSVAPLLCADQPLPQQRATARSQVRNAVLSDDFVPGGSPFTANDVNSRAAQLGRNVRLRHVPNWERRNPNARAPPTGNKKKRRK